MRISLLIITGVLFVLLSSCKSSTSKTSSENEKWDNTKVISKLAPFMDLYNFKIEMKREFLKEDPSYDIQRMIFPDESDDTQYIDLCSIILDDWYLDLSQASAESITFDDRTVFPTTKSKLPSGFNASKIMKLGINPGLNLQTLHKQGIDGRGVSMAIIDQRLSPHKEYNDNLAYYEEFLCKKNSSCDFPIDAGTMHAAAVSSIAVGQTVGVAPGAKLYYIAADWRDEEHFEVTDYYVKALNKIIEINKKLPDNKKIVVVSVSAGVGRSQKNIPLWEKALSRANQAGIFVTTTLISDEYGLEDAGLYRSIYSDSNNFKSYTEGAFQKREGVREDIDPRQTLCFPMDHRTVASQTGKDEYVHYAEGGMSWVKPYEAGVYVLAKQVKPSVTPEEFFEVSLKTGHYSKAAKCVIVDPVKLIENLKQ